MILSRPEWGAIPARSEFSPLDRFQIQFVTVHRDPELADGAPHSACPSALRSAQLRDQATGRADLRWNAVACPHGQLYDVRGNWYSAETLMSEVDRTSLAIAHLGTMTDEGMAAIFGYWTFAQALFPGANIATHRGWDPASTCPGNDMILAVEEWVRQERDG